MKALYSLLTTGVLGIGLAAFAQNTPPPRGPCQGTPHAWCDKDGDGICDRTGRPVGQGPARTGRGGQGGGHHGQCGHCQRANSPQRAQPAPAPSK